MAMCLAAVASSCSRPTLAPDAPGDSASSETGSTRAARAACDGSDCTAAAVVAAGKDARPTAIPILDAAELGALEPDGWRSTGLGDCAAVLEGQADAATAAPTASVRVLATASAIYLEVHDDAFSTAIDGLRMGFCGGDGKPTSCEAWSLSMDGWLLVTGPPRQSATGEWTEKKLSRRADVSLVSPTVRRFRLKPLPSSSHQGEASFTYRKAADGGSPRTVFEAMLDFQPPATAVHCLADAGALRRLHVGLEGGSGEALSP
ncbi:MAG TPA: hypothetical protein VGL81_11020 [Polyangiaceae bacterium]